MKSAVALIVMVILVPRISFSQKKLMKVDAALVANSKPMEAKRKGISVVGKYEFGQYKIVSGKAGWTRTKSRSRMFSGVTESQSKSKLSFLFIANNRDSVQVNTIVSTDTKELDLNRGIRFGNADWGQVLQSSTEKYLATIDLASDTTSWNLALVTAMGTEVRGSRFKGLLTSASETYEIREVIQFDDGKINAFGLILGYEFLQNGKSVAAVQASMNTFLKMYVWIDNRLDEPTQRLLAAAAATLLVRNQ
jgi:hypothetical protein